jgi:steroid delta-isomerase-like uncharacterized protein
MNDNKQVATAFWDALNNHDWERLASLVTPDFQHDNDVDYFYGREKVVELLKGTAVEGLDYYQHIDRVTGEGDIVISEATWTGNHIMDMWGFKATGKSFAVPVVYIMEFNDGLIKRLRSVYRDRKLELEITK